MYKLCHKCRLPYQEYKGTACNCMSKTYINDVPDTTEDDVIKSIQQACISDITRCIEQQRNMCYALDTLKQYSALFPLSQNRETKNEKLLRVLIYFFDTHLENLAYNKSVKLSEQLKDVLTKYFVITERKEG